MEQVYYGIIAALFAIMCTLVGIIYANLNARLNRTGDKSENHEHRIQSLEDRSQLTYDRIFKEIDDIKEEVRMLKTYVHDREHKYNEMFQQQKDVINRTHKYLEKLDSDAKANR